MMVAVMLSDGANDETNLHLFTISEDSRTELFIRDCLELSLSNAPLAFNATCNIEDISGATFATN
jgi:hypothetical protein